MFKKFRGAVAVLLAMFLLVSIAPPQVFAADPAWESPPQFTVSFVIYDCNNERLQEHEQIDPIVVPEGVNILPYLIQNHPQLININDPARFVGELSFGWWCTNNRDRQFLTVDTQMPSANVTVFGLFVRNGHWPVD
jgi:hypothetical protein